MLEKARIESGRTALERVPVDLPALVNDTDLMMRTRIEAAEPTEPSATLFT